MKRSEGILRFLLGLCVGVMGAAGALGQVKEAPAAQRPVEAPAAQRAAIAVTPTPSVSRWYFKIVGRNNSVFKGEASGTGAYVATSGWIFAESLHYEVGPSAATASGHSAGKPQWKTVTITKLMGASSPELFEAAARGDVLPDVTLVAVSVAGDGKEQVTHTIHMKDAVISSVKNIPGGKDVPLQEVVLKCDAGNLHVQTGDGKPMELDRGPGHQQIAAPVQH